MSSGQVEREYAFLTDGLGSDSALARYLQWVRDQLLPEFARKDSEALFFQKRHQRAIQFIYAAAVLAVATVAVQSLFLPDRPWLIWLEVGLIVAMIVVHRMDHRGEWLENWMQSRFLAEKLRYAAFTLLLDGLEEARGPRGRSFVAPGERDDAWRSLCEAIGAENRPSVDARVELVQVRRFIREKWLAPQRHYHQACAERYARKYERFERAGLVLLVCTIGAAVLHALGIGHHTPVTDPGAWIADHSAHASLHPDTHLTFGNLLTLTALVLPAASASLNAVKHVFELQKMSLRSRRMAQNIREFDKMLGEVEKPEQLRALVRDIEQLFMTEHEEWHSLLSFKRGDVG